jgi:hypothetical protein
MTYEMPAILTIGICRAQSKAGHHSEILKYPRFKDPKKLEEKEFLSI